MGFFNKILKGLGFNDEDEKPQKPKKEKKEKAQKINATFDLKNANKQDLEKQEPLQNLNEKEDLQTPSFSIIKVTNQVEVQNVILRLKQGEQILINMTMLESKDLTRSLDFLTGAVFALGLSMQKIEDSIFLIQ